MLCAVRFAVNCEFLIYSETTFVLKLTKYFTKKGIFVTFVLILPLGIKDLSSV